VIAVGAVVAAVVAYVTWSVLLGDPYARSERAVRDTRREIAAAMRDFERELETITRKAKPDRNGAGAEIDKRAAAAAQAIDDIVDRANDRLDQLDIDLRTQHNRMDRIERSAAEAKAMVKQLADEAKQKGKGS
jgi:small-conductance mechanosensitive channel